MGSMMINLLQFSAWMCVHALVWFVLVLGCYCILLKCRLIQAFELGRIDLSMLYIDDDGHKFWVIYYIYILFNENYFSLSCGSVQWKSK